MKLLLDMNLPPRLALSLNDRRFEALHWYFTGEAPNASDRELITYAQNYSYIILTCDLDFSAILSATHDAKPSIVQIRAMDLRVEEAVDLLSSALCQHKDDLEQGAIMTIDMKKARTRLLPL